MQDVSEATWQIMTRGRSGDTYHISTDEYVSIRELVERICAKMGVEFNSAVDVVGERLGKDAAYYLDSSKLRGELAWQDRISLDKGLDSCIDWVRANLAVLKEQPQEYQHKP
jgi:dTDP-glucose 4,6-dehydratase